jgi:hypothetical protein
VARTFRFRGFRGLVSGRQARGESMMVALECCVCEQRSEFTDDPGQAAGWGLAHLKSHRDHGTYRTLAAVPARVRSP